jgi:large subunit ribosomal protein L30
MAKTFIVTLKKGKAGCSKSQIATMTALGLRKRHHSVTVADHPANRGQIMKIQHLVDVEVKG